MSNSVPSANFVADIIDQDDAVRGGQKETLCIVDWFQIIEKTGAKKYSPIRIAGLDSQLADRHNTGLMDFDEDELNQIYQNIVTHLQTGKQ
jgi:hypothetical protein